jgi:hypothetical protein
MTPFTKVKKRAQAKAGAGWNRHVGKYLKRHANSVIRRALKQEAKEWE